MTPTNDQLNSAIAEAIDWERTIQRETDMIVGISGEPYRPSTIDLPIPDFCADRNLLYRLWMRLPDTDSFIDELSLTCGLTANDAHRHPQLWARCIMQACPRLHVIAALKALGKWPHGWTEYNARVIAEGGYIVRRMDTDMPER